jgi:hypothetical protein
MSNLYRINTVKKQEIWLLIYLPIVGAVVLKLDSLFSHGQLLDLEPIQKGLVAGLSCDALLIGISFVVKALRRTK